MKLMNLITFLSLFILFNTVAQSGEVIYQAEILTPNSNSKDKKVNAEVLKLLKSQKKIDYKLVFNTDKSLFKKIEGLKISDKKLHLVEALAGNGLYYFQKNDNLILFQTFFSDEYFIIKKTKIDWVITQNSKKIGEYICYEARAKKEIETRRGKSTRTISAWFAPDIPYNFGPKEYGYLPGLIIELKEDNLLLKAKEINLSTKKSIVIRKPTKGINVTQREYDSIIKKVILNSKRYRQ